MIRLKRAYEAPGDEDGARYLVERLWPRGVKKSSLPVAAWLKDAAPSTELRQWFSHDPARWAEFRSRYFAELEARSSAWAPLLEAARRGALTLIYSSHDGEHNNAVALRDFLTAKLEGGKSGGKAGGKDRPLKDAPRGRRISGPGTRRKTKKS